MIFNCDTVASELIDKVKDNIEVLDIPEERVFFDVLNTLLGQLYSGVITDIRNEDIYCSENGAYKLSDITDPELRHVRGCDVIKVKSGGYEYERVDASYSEGMLDEGEHLYKVSHDGDIKLLSYGSYPSVISVSYRAIPSMHTSDSERAIELPDEFLCLAEAKLYSEIYRILGEDALCANWTDEYNSIMTRFGVWLEVHGQ